MLDSNEMLEGTIPTELGQLTALTRLRFGSNDLVGSIPTELGNLGWLYILRLESNGLVGSIPFELGRLSGVAIISLGAYTCALILPSPNFSFQMK